MRKYVKTYLGGYHASGLVNNIPLFRGEATFLALRDLQHRYNMFPQNIAIYHWAWHKIHKTTHTAAKTSYLKKDVAQRTELGSKSGHRII